MPWGFIFLLRQYHSAPALIAYIGHPGGLMTPILGIVLADGANLPRCVLLVLAGAAAVGGSAGSWA